MCGDDHLDDLCASLYAYAYVGCDDVHLETCV